MKLAKLTLLVSILYSVLLVWDDNASQEKGFYIWRWTGGVWYYLIDTIAPNPNTDGVRRTIYLDSNTKRGRVCYIVTAFGDFGERDSNESCTKAP